MAILGFPLPGFFFFFFFFLPILTLSPGFSPFISSFQVSVQANVRLDTFLFFFSFLRGAMIAVSPSILICLLLGHHPLFDGLFTICLFRNIFSNQGLAIV